MDFYEVLDQITDLLRQRGRVSYRALKRQYGLDDDYLEDLKVEIVKVQQLAIEQDGEMLVWTGDPAPPEPDVQRGTDAESQFHALLSDVVGGLQQEGRVTYRTLKFIFGLDDTLMEEIREELTLRRLAVDEEGKVLIWTGETPHITSSVVSVPSPPATSDT